jgi:hypothetical protein
MSILKVTTLQNSAGTEVYTAKAWVNFNGAGTVAIRASGNTTSITDNGVGDFTVNFTTIMVDANYAFNLSRGALPSNGFIIQPDSSTIPTTAALRVACVIITNASSQDVERVCVAISR